MNAGSEWQNNYFNFDNMYQAIASLFVISNLNGWSNFMYIGAQVTDYDKVWEQWSHPYWIFFFIIFVVTGSFFFMNLFVGVVISSFNKEKDRIHGADLISSKNEMEWIDI